MRLEKLVKSGIPELVIKSRKEGISQTAKAMDKTIRTNNPKTSSCSSLPTLR
jgi:hypothetical protein